jgi:hypothetical protein
VRIRRRTGRALEPRPEPALRVEPLHAVAEEAVQDEDHATRHADDRVGVDLRVRTAEPVGRLDRDGAQHAGLEVGRDHDRGMPGAPGTQAADPQPIVVPSRSRRLANARPHGRAALVRAAERDHDFGRRGAHLARRDGGSQRRRLHRHRRSGRTRDLEPR